MTVLVRTTIFTLATLAAEMMSSGPPLYVVALVENRAIEPQGMMP